MAKVRSPIYTRARRQRDGLPPLSPLFRDVARHLPQAPAKRCHGNRDEDSSSDDEETVWVQCDRHLCRKWRRLPQGHSIDCSQTWYCDMHPDPAHSLCDIPEEKWKEVVSRKSSRFDFSPLQLGDLVWAKLGRYSPWPAVVSHDPWCEDLSFVNEEEEGRIYHVEFLGKPRSHCWLPEGKLELFYGTSTCSLATIQMSKKLDFALQEASSLHPLDHQQRLQQCWYRTETITKPERDHEATENSTNSKPEGKKKVLTSSSLKQDAQPPKRPQVNVNTATDPLSLFHTLGFQLNGDNIFKIAAWIAQTANQPVVPASANTILAPTDQGNKSKPVSQILQPPLPHPAQQPGRKLPTSNALRTVDCTKPMTRKDNDPHTTVTEACVPQLSNGSMKSDVTVNSVLTSSLNNKSSGPPKSSAISGSKQTSRPVRGRRSAARAHGPDRRKSFSKLTSPSHIIPEYFSPTALGTRCDQGAAISDQRVPDWTESVSVLECQVTEELHQMEEMLSQLDGMKDSHSLAHSTGVDIESVFSQMDQIDDLMNKLY